VAIAVDGSSPAVAAGSGATLSTAAFTPPNSSVIWAFAQADANNGSADEALSFSDSSSGTWSTPIQDNARGGAVVAAAYRLCPTSIANLTVTLTDNKGSVAKRLFVRVFTGTDQANPQGATATAGTAAISYTSTVPNSWGWSVYLGSNATVTAGTATTLQDETGGFDSGDAVATFSATSTTATPGTTVTLTEVGGTAVHHVAVEIVPPSSAPALPPALQRRRTGYPRASRGRTAVPVRAQVNPPLPTIEAVQPRRVRGMLGRRGHQPQVVLPQVNPPLPITVAVQPRRLRGLLLRRGRAVVPTTTQAAAAAPAFPAPVLAVRRIRGLLARRGRALLFPAPDVSLPGVTAVRRLRGATVRRGRPTLVVGPQLNPPYPTAEIAAPRRLRGLLLRRGRNPVPTITQVSTTPPAFPFGVLAQARRLRGAPARRGRLTVVVQPQVNPPIPIAEAVQPRRVRGLLARRGRFALPVQLQQTFANPAWVPPWRRNWTIPQPLRRPGKVWQPPWVGAAPAPARPVGPARRSVRLAAVRRGRTAQPIGQVPFVPPAPRRGRLVLPGRRTRQLVPLAAAALPVVSPKPVRVRPLAVRRARAAQLRLIGAAAAPRTGRLASTVVTAGSSSGARLPGMSSTSRASGNSSITSTPGMSSGTITAGMVSGT